MKYSLKFTKYKGICSLSFERRIALTLVGLFLLVFVVAMGGLKFTNFKLTKIFSEIESRNILAAKQNLEHDLSSWNSSLALIANSAQISEWYEYKKYGLSREEQRYYSKLEKYFEDANKNQSGLSNITLESGLCDRLFKIIKEKNLIRVCANHKSNPVSISAEADLSKLESSIHQFVPNGEISSAANISDAVYSLENIPGITLKVNQTDQIANLIQSFSMILPITLGILLIGTLVVLFFMWSKLLRAQTNVLNYITNILSGNSKNVQAPQSLGFSDLESTMKGVVDKVIAFEQNQKETELLNLSKQISHDIRSPLTALNLLSSSLTELPEAKRILVRNSINRINDIANSLLERSKKPSEPLNTCNAATSLKQDSDVIMVSSLIDSIVSEKRIQFRELADVQIESRTEMAYGLFVNVVSKELKRIISNLINNSVEAFKEAKGEVVISVISSDDSVLISIQDNGMGIPKEVLNRIGQQGFSFGKSSSSQSGSGLGVFHAKQTIESFKGSLEIDSELGKGTRITIELPKAIAPDWFVNSLELTTGQTLVICDDDTSIHQIWSGRIKSLNLDSKINLLNFSSGQAFKSWVKEKSMASFNCLVDFELLNQPQTGLDIIEELGIQNKSVLVTSRYEESHIRNRCDKLGLKLIPKDVAGFVPIQLMPPQIYYEACLIDDDPLVNRPIGTNSSPMEIATEKIRYDLCLIDDDQALIGVVWAMEAASKGLKIKLFATPQAFVAEADKIDPQTPIYVDVSLGNGVSGLDVAHDIHKMGFTEINLATGYQADSMKVPPFISSVVGKDFPNVGYAGAPTS
jgi:signal transduction histidine kinase